MIDLNCMATKVSDINLIWKFTYSCGLLLNIQIAMEQQEPIDSTIASKRPVFITVLCILSFVISAFALYSSAVSSLQARLMQDFSTLEQTMDSAIKMSTTINDSLRSPEQKAVQDMSKKIMKHTLGGMSASNIYKAAIANLCYGLLTLLGALLMWRLRKIGYWLYLLGILISFIAPVAIYGTDNWIGLFTSLGLGLLGITMVVLFTINKKHLVN